MADNWDPSLASLEKRRKTKRALDALESPYMIRRRGRARLGA